MLLWHGYWGRAFGIVPGSVFYGCYSCPGTWVFIFMLLFLVVRILMSELRSGGIQRKQSSESSNYLRAVSLNSNLVESPEENKSVKDIQRRAGKRDVSTS